MLSNREEGMEERREEKRLDVLEKMEEEKTKGG